MRIDWYSVGFRVALSQALLTRLLARIGDGTSGPTRFDLAGDAFEAKATAKSGFYLLTSLSCVVRIEVQGAEGWTVTVEFSGQRMAVTSAARAVELARRYAAALGEVCGERVRRLDLCADVAGWALVDTVDVESYVKPRKGKWGEYNVERDESSPQLERYMRGLRVTGISLCPGGDVQARLYDKRAELAIRGHGKRATEEERWTAGGWDGVAPVTRVEFQLRGAALHEMTTEAGRNLRDGAETCLRNLDRIWAYLTTWFRLIQPGTATRRTRAAVDPRWAIVQRIAFVHSADPTRRVRRRGGASAGQVFGATLSAVAAAGELTIDIVGELGEVTELGEVADEGQLVAALEPAAASLMLRGLVKAVFDRGAELVTRETVERFGGVPEALSHVLTRTRATRARFTEAA